jgi:hypothetical protein
VCVWLTRRRFAVRFVLPNLRNAAVLRAFLETQPCAPEQAWQALYLDPPWETGFTPADLVRLSLSRRSMVSG